MGCGYVYILRNDSMPGLVKIGRTARDVRSRVRELSSDSGVPSPFEVAFEVFSEDCENLEEQMHNELEDFRVNSRREFFKYPLKDSIQLLLRLHIPPTSSDSIFSSASIFKNLKEMYSEWLKPNIVDVQIVQTNKRVWLEITEETEKGSYLVDQIISRTDLGFISDGDYSCVDNGEMFKISESVTYNAEKFLADLCPYSIIMTTDLFHDVACEEINKKHNQTRSSKS